VRYGEFQEIEMNQIHDKSMQDEIISMSVIWHGKGCCAGIKKGYLLDMDGVIYRGGEVIPGVVEFVRRLRETDTPFLFLTNNSQRTRRDVATKLCRMGIDATEDDVFTCAMATARFLARQKPGGMAYVIGGRWIIERTASQWIFGGGRFTGLCSDCRRSCIYV
jgi:hypothetical protein